MADLLNLTNNRKKRYAQIGRILLFCKNLPCSESDLLLLLPQGRSECCSELVLILDCSCLLGVVMTLEIQCVLGVLPALTDVH